MNEGSGVNRLTYQAVEHQKRIMSGRISIVGCLTNLKIGSLILLTLIAFTTHRLHPSYADATSRLSAEQDARLHDAKNYLREQGMRQLSALPGSLRDDFDRLAKGWHPLTDDDASDGEGAPNLTGAPAAQPNLFRDLPFDLNAHYHHKGFLPTHDALVLGGTYTHTMDAGKIRLDLKPYYGQSWHGLSHYWGGEMTLDLAKRADDLPWGRVTLGYVSGKENLTDHGTGMDLHGDLDLTEGWTFTSGVRQDPYASDSSYVLLKWKLGL